MLSEHVGEEKFLKGVSIYLKKRLYGNSVTRDLWDGISEATGMFCWTCTRRTAETREALTLLA
jgi:hypothetical protein